jgi:ArsR family transcriptional regulator
MPARSAVATCCPSITTAPLAERDAATLAKGYAALGDPVRLRLFSMLAAADGEVCACAFVDALHRSQPTVSHHLKVLADAGLVIGEKRGRWIWYSVVSDRLDTLRDALAAPALA